MNWFSKTREKCVISMLKVIGKLAKLCMRSHPDVHNIPHNNMIISSLVMGGYPHINMSRISASRESRMTAWKFELIS